MPSDPTCNPTDEVLQVAAALHGSVGLLVRRLKQMPAPGELSLPERSALSRLNRAGPATSSALAKAEQISPQSMGVTLAGLEARGLVRREADATDGRRIVITVTDAGLELLRDRRTARVQQFAQALQAGFTPAEIARLGAAAPLFERLADSL